MHHLVAEEAGNPRKESEAAGWLPTEARRVPGESWVCRGPPCPILRALPQAPVDMCKGPAPGQRRTAIAPDSAWTIPIAAARSPVPLCRETPDHHLWHSSHCFLWQGGCGDPCSLSLRCGVWGRAMARGLQKGEAPCLEIALFLQPMPEISVIETSQPTEPGLGHLPPWLSGLHSICPGLLERWKGLSEKTALWRHKC